MQRILDIKLGKFKMHLHVHYDSKSGSIRKFD